MRLSRAGLRRGVAVLAAGLLVGVSVQLSGSASAAVVRYEAESATIVQGADPRRIRVLRQRVRRLRQRRRRLCRVDGDGRARRAGEPDDPVRQRLDRRPARRHQRERDVVADERSFPDHRRLAELGDVEPERQPRGRVRTRYGRPAPARPAGRTSTAWRPTPAARTAPGDLQAENATIVQGVVESNHAGFTGTGFVNYNNVAGSYVEWTVTTPPPGRATLGIRYANGTGRRTGRWASRSTARWSPRPPSRHRRVDHLDDRHVSATLNAGTNTVRATATTAGGGPNVDRLDVSTGGGGDTQPPTVPGNLRVTGTTSSQHQPGLERVHRQRRRRRLHRARGQHVVASPTGTTATITGLAPKQQPHVHRHRPRRRRQRVRPQRPDTGTTQPGGAGNTPVAINGQLRVCGIKLCNQYGKPIQLRGMSTHGLQWYPQCVNNASLDALANDWNADILRHLDVRPGGRLRDQPARLHRPGAPARSTQATARGMYAIVDWHMLTPGDPNANLARAKTFFAEIAQRHGNKPNVLYEIANEPNGVSWARIKSYHEQVIPVIRAHDPDSVILLGTRGWSLAGRLRRRATRPRSSTTRSTPRNIMYTFHFYAGSHGTEYLDALSRAADRIPMFVTEFGTQTYIGRRRQQLRPVAAVPRPDGAARRSAGRTGTTPTTSAPARSSRRAPARMARSPALRGSRRPAAWVRDRIQSPPDNFPTN